MIKFDKYEKEGSYHWEQADPSNPRYNPLLIARYELVANRVERHSKRVLDAGCGDGYLSYLLAKRDAEQIVGIDNSHLGVKLAQERIDELPTAYPIAFQCGSLYEIPFPNETFDAIVHADVIEHLDTPEKALAEMRRVLKPKGKLVLSTPNWHPERPLSPMHVQEFKPSGLRTLLSPYFSQIQIVGAWHGLAVYYWKRQGRPYRLMRFLARRLGINVFAFTTHNPTPTYEQLIVECRV